ncbi:MAG TPA: hypothetical protein VL172_04990, partial [Kofleriaceae bacterium]|nr:hypothetical protein [Kofleriaceae bacterium]
MRAAVLLLAVAACSGGGPRGPRCQADGTALASIDKQRGDGWLHQALAGARAEQKRCASAEADLAVAGTLADLGLDVQAAVAYRGAAERGGAAATTAAAALAELGKRPPANRTPTAEQAAQARLLYRDGVNLRLAGKPDDAIRQLRRAYALAPHPLTVVQIALAHKAAGREAEYRKASARALAMAEDSRGARAEPHLRGGHTDEVTALAFHPRGHLLATASIDGTARVWDLATGRELHLLPHEAAVTGLAFAGDTLVTLTSLKGQLRTWDADSGAALATVAVDGAPEKLAAAGNLVATGGYSVDLIDLATGQRRTGPQVIGAAALALSPDGKLIASRGMLADKVEIHDAISGAEVASLPVGGDFGAVLAFAPDSRSLAIGAGTQLQVFAIGDRHPITSLGLPGEITALAFDPAGDRVAVGGHGWAQLRRLAGGPPVDLGGDINISAMAFAPDGSRIAGAGRSPAEQVLVPVWSADGGPPVRTLAAPGLPATGLWFQDAALVAAGA